MDAVRAVVRRRMTTKLLLVVLERPGLLLQARDGRGDLAAAAATSKRLHVYSMRRISLFSLFGRAQLTELTQQQSSPGQIKRTDIRFVTLARARLRIRPLKWIELACNTR